MNCIYFIMYLAMHPVSLFLYAGETFHALCYNLLHHISFRRYGIEIINEQRAVQEQYKTGENLNTRISDIVIANMMLYHVSNLDQGLSEVKRV